SPQAIKDFLAFAVNNWQGKPRFVLLCGDASYDPKNYLGFGNFDLVPTKLLDTDYLETASDDWFADFNNDGIADLNIGRLPVRTLTEATVVINKILRYTSPAASPSALLVSDRNDGFDFEDSSAQINHLLAPRMAVLEIKRGQIADDADARSKLLEQL